jgi:hypothetical protein
VPSNLSALLVTLDQWVTNMLQPISGIETRIYRLFLATFRRKKPFSDDRATKLGARTRRQVAADKL